MELIILILILICIFIIYCKTSKTNNANIKEKTIEGLLTSNQQHSDYIYPGKYTMVVTPKYPSEITGKTIYDNITYLNSKTMVVTNLLHSTKNIYNFKGSSENGGTYINSQDPSKRIIYDKKNNIILMMNGANKVEFSIVMTELKAVNEKEDSTVSTSEYSEPVSYGDLINLAHHPRNSNDDELLEIEDENKKEDDILPDIVKQFGGNKTQDYYVGYADKDTWILALSKKENLLLKESFYIKRIEELTMRHMNMPVKEIYYFALMSTLQLHLKSLPTKDRNTILKIINELNIIIEEKVVHKKGNLITSS